MTMMVGEISILETVTQDLQDRFELGEYAGILYD